MLTEKTVSTLRLFKQLNRLIGLTERNFNMEDQNTQATLSTSVVENSWFYAMRPDWLESDTEREAFKTQFPELVARNADCWQEAQA
jgi:Asp-tRNA(Asn)/Glu-tRNA(Gln) amidotransferase C subunit